MNDAVVYDKATVLIWGSVAVENDQSQFLVVVELRPLFS